MGKATELDDRFNDRELSPAEIMEREAAAKSGGASEATVDGKLVRRGGPSGAAEVIVEAPHQTWD